MQTHVPPAELADPRPRSRMTARVRRDVLVDAAAYRLVTSRAAPPDPALLERVGAEVDAGLDLFARNGWLDDPVAYHRDPSPVGSMRARRARSGNLRFTQVSWLDGFSPRSDEPGAERFAGYRANRVARATLLEHRSGDRPWLVCLHGFGMGRPALDLRAFRALRLHRDLGLNVAFLTLPFHGRRNPASGALPPVPGPDVFDSVHALTQAVWDTRQLLRHLQSRTEAPVGLMGLSLGGLVSATVASIEAPHAVLLLVPAVDLPSLAADASADGVGPADAGDLLARAEALFAPVSPLRLSPKVTPEQSFIVAGTLDRFARPSSQAVALWRHWNQPDLHWYHGGHASMFWARGVQDAIEARLRAAGLA